MKSRLVAVTVLGFVALAVLLALLAGSAPTIVAQEGNALPDSVKVLVDVDATVMLKQLPTLGGKLLQDYGAFSLWLVPGAQAASLTDRSGVTLHPDFDSIGLRDGAIDTRVAKQDVPANLREEPGQGAQFWMVQYAGPIKAEWLTQIQAADLDVVMYMPNNAYVVWGQAPAEKLTTLAASNRMIQWSGAYHPAYRLSPSLREIAAKPEAIEMVDVTVQFYTTAATPNSLNNLLKLSGAVHKSPERILGFTNISLQVPANRLIEIANWSDVFNVEPWAAPQKYDEVQDQILAGNVVSTSGVVLPNSPGYINWLASKSFPTTPSSYPIVDIVDDGIDQGNANNVLHPDFHELGVLANPDRVIYIQNCTTDPLGNGVAGHGNLNAGIVGAYNNLSGFPYVDANGYRIGLGVSPYGRVAGTKIFRNSGTYDASGCSNTDAGVVAASYNAGAQLTSNSWGADVGGAYDTSSQAYDQLTRDASSTTSGNQEMLHVFAAGNAGAGSNTVGSPATGKNVLSVGATENVRDDGVIDGCNYSGANNADDIATFSSRGPTDDGRYKPEIMAPGTHVQGPASQDPGYSGTGVCGGPGGTKYYPAGQTLYTWSSGTSHSTPAVAGTASLVWNYYGRVLKPSATPSPAMLKALLLNSTRYLQGSGTGGTLPSNNQGWGDANLGMIFDGTPRVLVDQNQLLTATGQDQFYYGSIMDPSKPFRVTLVWTEPPGSTTGNSYVNNLDLEVTVNGVTYKGNVFSGAYSTSGGTADAKNNVESVFLPAGASGAYTVRVVATNLAGDGVPGTGTATDQDYALVIYNNSIGPAGTLAGQVRDANTAAPQANALIGISSVPTQTYNLFSDASGNYSILIPVGTYTVTAAKYGYLPATLTGVSIVSGTTTTQNISLTVAPTYVISGFVKDSVTNDPLWATVAVIGTPFNPPFASVQTDPATGFYSMTLAGGQSYTLTASALIHTPASQGITPVSNQTVNFNLVATSQNGGIIGWVRNFYTNDPIAGATVQVAAPGNPQATTDATGYFQIFNLTPGFYTATASANLYSPVSISNIQVLTSNFAIRTFLLPTSRLNYAPTSLNKTLTFGSIVTDSAGLVISNTGLGALTFELQEQAGGFAPLRPAVNDFVVVGEDSSTTSSFTQALTSLGYTYDVMTVATFNGMTPAALLGYKGVLYAGNNSAGSSLSLLTQYLDAGGRLLISGNDFGYYNGSLAFYTQYLEAQYVADNATSGNGSVVGEDIMNGLSGSIAADPFPDQYTISGTHSTRVFVYSTTGPGNNGPAGSRIARNSYKAVYLPFRLYYLGTVTVGEQIEKDVMARALTWLVGVGFDAIPWISESPITGTLAQSATQNIQLAWNANIAAVSQPGTYTGSLKIANNDPVAQNTVLPVVMTVNPAASQGLLKGIVSSTGICDVNLAPINGAQVYIQGTAGFTQTLFTNATGAYGYYLDQAQSPYTVTVSYADHSTTTVSVGITGGVTTTQNFTLRLQKPCINIDPKNLQATLQLGNATSRTLYLTSTGALPLDYNLFEVPASLPIGGGPDAFGYTWITSTYGWIDATGGTALGLADDGEANVTSPFAFPYYGGSATALRVGNNGATLFNATIGDVSTAESPMVSAPDNFIAVFWDDIDSDTGDVYWQVIGSAPNRKLVIEWYNRPHFSNVGSATFEMVLFENGNILYQYQDVDFGNASYNNGASATVGIRGVGAANSLQYSYDQPKLNANQAICFVRPGNAPCDAVDVPWLSESITSTVGLTGTPPTSQMINVTFDAAQVPLPGVYTANLLFSHNSPQPAVNIPVTLTVSAPPNYGTINGLVNGLAACDLPGAPLQGATVAINGGAGGTATTNASGQYLYSLIGNTGTPYTLTVSYAGYVSQSANITVTQSTTTTTNFNLRLLTPCQSLSANALSSTQPNNQIVIKTLTISNTGTTVLTWNIQELAPALANVLRTPVTLAAPVHSVRRLSVDPSSPVVFYPSPTHVDQSLALINDGSFENAPSAWTEVDNTVCTPWIGDWSSIVGVTAYHGTQYFWAGGYCGAPNSNSASQTVAIPTGVNKLTFYYYALRSDPDDTTNGYAYVRINGTNVFTLPMITANNTTGWVQASADISAYVGQSVTLTFGAVNQGTGVGNVFFDYVETAHVVSCQPNSLPWVSTVPVSGTVAAGSSSNVNVVFDSTGLSAGVYTGTLCYNSNDTVAPNVQIPVALNIQTVFKVYLPVVRK